ncbi:MAG: hypothetical protein ACD_37C00628G0001 [uncultured bacterium]|nr:MAG: hypothetical protein ACD_37C00628G0001 [uncultured bacterium]
MQYWLDESFALNAASVLTILAVTYFFVSLYTQLQNFLLGLGRTKFLAISSFIMAVINIVLLLILLPRYGIVGAAWAYLISLLPVIYMMYYLEKNILKLTGQAKYNLLFYLKLLITGTIFYLIILWAINPFIIGFKSLLLFGSFSVLMYLFLYYILGFYEEEDIVLVRNYFKVLYERLTSFIH